MGLKEDILKRSGIVESYEADVNKIIKPNPDRYLMSQAAKAYDKNSKYVEEENGVDNLLNKIQIAFKKGQKEVLIALHEKLGELIKTLK